MKTTTFRSKEVINRSAEIYLDIVNLWNHGLQKDAVELCVLNGFYATDLIEHFNLFNKHGFENYYLKFRENKHVSLNRFMEMLYENGEHYDNFENLEYIALISEQAQFLRQNIFIV